MTLQKQLIDVPIVGGIDEHTDSRLVARATTLINCCHRKAGAIEKRYGSELLIARATDGRRTSATTPVTASVPAPLLLCSYGDTLVRVGARTLHTLSEGKTYWSEADNVPSVNVSRRPVGTTSVSVGSVDLASNGTTVCNVWSDTASRTGTGSVWMAISRLDTGESILAPYVLGTGRQIKVCYLSGGNYIVTWVDSATGDIFGVSVSATTPTVAAPTTIITDGIKAGALTVTAYALEACGSVFAIGYETALGVRIRSYTSAFAVHAAVLTTYASTPITAVAMCWAAGEQLWWGAIGNVAGTRTLVVGTIDTALSFVDTAQVAVDTTEDASPVIINQTYQNFGIIRSSATAATVVYDVCVSSAIGGISVATVTKGAGPGTITRVNGALSLMSRPWSADGRTFFVASLASRLGTGVADANHIVFECPGSVPGYDVCRPVGRFGPGIGYYPFPFSHTCNVYGTNTAYFALPFASDAGGERTSLWTCTAAFETGATRQAVELGGALYLGGGILSVFDGNTVAEVGFLAPPSIESTASPASGFLPAGDYTYVFVWEATDAAGRVHRSAPSTPVTVTAALNDRIDISVRQLSATTKQDDLQYGAAIGVWSFVVELVAYRLSGGEYYRMTSSIGGTTNDYRSYYQTFSDTGSATITSNPRLYTSGNVLPHVAPPGCRVLCAHQSRIFTDSDDGTIWYSNPVGPGEVASFTLDFRIPPFEGGAVTALASLDSNLVVFKESSVWVVSGQGPNATGGGSQYSAPQRLTGDIGCTSARSVVECPLGLMFQSLDGIAVLTRGLQVSTDIGTRIEDSLATYAPIGAATHVPSQSQVRFEGTSRRFVYDYHHDAWSVDVVSMPDSVSNSTSPVRGAALSNDRYTWVTADGSLYRETPTSWLDSGAWVQMYGTFGNLRVGAVDGMCRLWRIALNGYKYSAFGFTFGATDVADHLWTGAQIDALYAGSGLRVKFEGHVADQLKEYVQVGFADLAPSSLGTGRGMSITGFTLEVGVRGTTSRRLAAGARK